MSRPRHPNKHIESAVQYAESLNWRVRMSPAHAWGHLLCPLQTREGCRISVWSTPRNPENHARQIRRDIDACRHEPSEPTDGGEGDGDEDRDAV